MPTITLQYVCPFELYISTPLLLYMVREDGKKCTKKEMRYGAVAFLRLNLTFRTFILIFRLNVGLHKVLTLPLSLLP